MPPKKAPPVEELLTKILAINLWMAGVSQPKIASTVGKGNDWVNKLMKGLPKRAKNSKKD